MPKLIRLIVGLVWGLVLFGCNLNPPEIRYNKIEERSVFKGFPILILNTNHEVNPFEKVNCSFSEISKNNTTEPFFGKLKIRSGDHPEKKQRQSYTIALFEAYGFAGLPSSKDWILSSSSFDPTFVKDRFGYYLFGAMDGEAITAQSCYVQLFMNGIDEGLYILKEKLDENRLDLSLEDPASCIFKQPEIFIPNGRLYDQKFPDAGMSDRSRWMVHLQKLIHQAADEEFFHEENGIFSYFDLDNLLNWHCMLLLTGDQSGMNSNFVLYRQHQERKYRFTVWDFDNAFGSDWKGDHILFDTHVDPNRMFQRLLENDTMNYHLLLAGKWKHFRDTKTIDSAVISKWISEQTKPLANLYAVSDTGQVVATAYQGELIDLKTWIKNRIEFLDDHFNYP